MALVSLDADIESMDTAAGLLIRFANDRVASIKRWRNAGLPIHRLPAELLIRIFHLLVPIWGNDDIFASAFARNTLRLICHRWHDVISSSAHLNSRLVDLCGVEDLNHVDGDSPIVLYCRWGAFRQTCSFHRLISPALFTRCRAMVVCVSGLDILKEGMGLSSNKFQNLLDVSVMGTGEPHLELDLAQLGSVPGLRGLRMVLPETFRVPGSAMTSLTHLELSTTCLNAQCHLRPYPVPDFIPWLRAEN